MKKWHYFIIILSVFFLMGCSADSQKKEENENLNISTLDLSKSNLENLSLKNYDVKAITSLNLSANQLKDLPESLKRCKKIE
jgi:Leucine-rich repeat (LRR) protein